MPTTTSTRDDVAKGVMGGISKNINDHNDGVWRSNRSKTQFLSWGKIHSRRSKRSPTAIATTSRGGSATSNTPATAVISATNTLGTASLCKSPFSASSSSSSSSASASWRKMVVLTEDVNAPPRHIFDPPDQEVDESFSDAETYTTRESLSTVGKRRNRKHPSQLNEIELRIQLWDAYRLARIILGTPIRSFSLKGKTILHSIRKVAEMKMELIRLENEVEMSKVFRESMGDLTGLPPQPLSDSRRSSSTSLAQDLNEKIAGLLVAKKDKQQQKRARSKTPNRRTTGGVDKRSQSQDASVRTGSSGTSSQPLESNSSAKESSRSGTKSLSTSDRLDLVQSKYKALQQTHEDMMNDFQMQLRSMKAELTTSLESPQESVNVGEEKEGDILDAIDPTIVESSSNVPKVAMSRSATDSTEFIDNRVLTTEEKYEKGRQHLGSIDVMINGVLKEEGSSSDMSAGTALRLAATQVSNEGDDKSVPVSKEVGTVVSVESNTPPTDGDTPMDIPSEKVNETLTDNDFPQSAPEPRNGTQGDSAESEREIPENSTRKDSSFSAVISTSSQVDNANAIEEESNSIDIVREVAPLTISPPSAPDDTTDFARLLSPTAQELKTLNEENLVERRRLQKLIEDLMEKVEKTTKETREQFDALENQIQIAASFDSRDKHEEVNHPDDDDSEYMSEGFPGSDEIILTQGQFEKRLQTVHTLHTLELETSKTRHTQQVVDMAGQLDAYQQQVENQNTELQKWRRKYHHLEEMAVTPAEAQEVLAELESMTPHSTQEEHEKVQIKVVRVLQRMAHLHTRQEKERRRMEKTRKAAHMREAESKEQLEFLRLQKEILDEDTEVSPEEWQQQLAQQRKSFQKEVTEILEEEEKRMMEMDYLEVQLTELAFLAVEVEDLEKEYQSKETEQSQIITRARQRLELTAPVMEDLKSRVNHMKERQQDSIQHLMYHQDEESPKRVEVENLETKIKAISNSAEAHETLRLREEELRKAKAELQASQDRVLELEAEIIILRPSHSMSNNSEATSA